MKQDATVPSGSKSKYRAWLLVFGVCVPGVVLGRQVGKWITAALGFQVPPGGHVPLYDGRIPGGIYGGIGTFIGGCATVSLRNRWLALGISLVAGILFAAVGAVLER